MLSGIFITVYSCTMCGYFGDRTGRRCNKCNKDIVEGRRDGKKIKECLGCHDKWTSPTILALLTERIENKVFLLEQKFYNTLG